MPSFERCAIDENGNLVKITIGGDTELVLTGSCVLATSATAPPGTLIADGSEVSRQAYDKLFAKIGTDYGEGDGETTFALPDWRDEFPRFSGAERAVGTKQGDAIQNIEGAFNVRSVDSNDQYFSSVSGAFAQNRASDVSNPIAYANNNAYLAWTINFDASRVVPTAEENRPRNVAFLPCIVYI